MSNNDIKKAVTNTDKSPTSDNPLDVKKEDSELQAHISIVRQTIEEMKKNPAYVREAFFISLLEAYDAVDETFKKRTIALNIKLLNLQKVCNKLENLDKTVENKLLESTHNKLDLVINEFDKKLERLSDPLQNISQNTKNVGMALSKLNKQLVHNLEENNSLNIEIRNNVSNVSKVAKLLPILITSNFLLVGFVLFLIFSKFIHPQ